MNGLTDISLPDSLEDVRIQSLPQSAFYIADFLTEEEQHTILDKIYNSKSRWKELSHRRLQTWPSELVKNTLIAAPLPPFLKDPIIPRLLSIARSSGNTTDHIFSDSPQPVPNHCLINEYLPGQGIMPHKDGSTYWPVVATISLDSSLCLDIYKANADGTRDVTSHQRILQEPRSLLITTDDMYTSYFHGISDVLQDENLSAESVANWSLLRDPQALTSGTNTRERRVSLTYRAVLKVSSIGQKLGIFGRRPL